MAIGYIYVLSNEHMPGLVKVGYSCESVEMRARQIFTTGVPSPFHVEYFRLTEDVDKVEGAAHAALAQRVSPNREFFKIPIDDAIRVVDKLVREPERAYRRSPAPVIMSQLIECRRCGYEFKPGDRYPHCPKCYPG